MIEIIDATSMVSRSKEYPHRKDIKRIYVHHSGRAGKEGLEGAKNTSRYVVRHRGFPGPAYHYWIPFTGTSIYLLNDVFRRCWHTGGAANTHGIGVCLQGNTTLKPMSEFQCEALHDLLKFLRVGHVLSSKNPVSWHSASAKYGGKAKAACPGSHATAWLKGWCARIPHS